MRKDDLKFGFVILSTEHNIGRLIGTNRSIKNHYGDDMPVMCVTDKGANAACVKEMKEVCPVYRGKETVTSLLNLGMKKGHPDWNIFVMEGSWVRGGLNYKYQKWIENEKDILFPIVCDYDRNSIPVKIYKEFEECTLNGLCIHQKTFKDVGDFSENPLNISRRFWALEAASQGCKFKAILGAKIC